MMADDSEVDDVSPQYEQQQQQQQQQVDQDSDSEHDQHHVVDHSSSSSSSSPTIMSAGDDGAGRDVSEAEGPAAKDRPDRVFDIVLPSPTGPPPSNGASASALTSPATPSTSGGWSMSSSTDGSATVCYGDERLMLTELGRRFYNRRALSDVKLRVGERVYRCHKLLLALSSDVLERMLCSADWTDAVKQASSSYSFNASSHSLLALAIPVICGIYYFILVSFRFGFRKKTRIQFGMSLVRFGSKKTRFWYYLV